MITFPNAKINLGLNVIAKRADGYHNLQTVFYPLYIEDALEIVRCATFESPAFELSGIKLEGKPEDNLVMKALKLLREDYPNLIPPIHTYLHKHIPSGAGLGGGSADASFMLRLLNEEFSLGMDEEALLAKASLLGSDCPFFIKNEPVFAEGTGNLFSPIDISLKGYFIVLVKPSVIISTREAFAHILTHKPKKSVKTICEQPIETWKTELKNDFEDSIFPQHPELATIKKQLYDTGATYAAMSGSGSSLFGIYKNSPDEKIKQTFKDNFIWTGRM